MDRKSSPFQTRDELKEYSRLYRKVVSDFAYARSNYPGHPVIRELEVLVGRAHSQFYSATAPKKETVYTFYMSVFPQLFRKNLHLFIFSAAIFFFFTVIGFVLTLDDWQFAEMILSPDMISCIQDHELWTGSINSIKPVASSKIATNNISVTIAAFAFGVLLGIGTFYLVAFNGLLFGTVLAATYLYGLMWDIIAFVLPHGVIEIPVIFIASSGGFLMGKALLFPGRYGRREEFQIAAATGAQLILGCIPLLLIAGTIEAYVSPSHLPVWARLGVCAIAAIFMWVYLFKFPLRKKELS